MQSYVGIFLAFVTSNQGDQLFQFAQDFPTFNTESLVPELQVLGKPGRLVILLLVSTVTLVGLLTA